MSLLEGFSDLANLDDKKFEDILKEARALLARYGKEWTDHNITDPGITFIELFAWLAEMQMYYLNQVTDANYKKFLKLVGIHPLEAQSAKVDITFENIPDDKVNIIEAGKQVYTELGAEKIVFEPEEDITLIPAKIKSIITIFDSKIIDNTKANEKEDVYFAAFGERAPAGATLKLGFDKSFPEKETSITFVLLEADLKPVGRHNDELPLVFSSVKVVWEYNSSGKWKKLPVKKDTTMALTRSGRVVFDWLSDITAEDNSLYWVRCSLKEGAYEIAPKVDRILLNTVPAVQIEKITKDLGNEKGVPDMAVQLENNTFIKRMKIQIERANGENEYWHEVEDFDSSGPEDKHYRFDRGRNEIIFGNGLNGSIPAESEKIKAIYETTVGEKGNIPKEQKFLINGYPGISGRNFKAATGGKVPETLDEAINRAKRDCRKAYRAITSEDYEYLALSTPGLRVARAKAIPNYYPEFPSIKMPDTVTVVAVPYTREESVNPIAGAGFLSTIQEHLNKHRLITTNVQVIRPEYIKIAINCSVHIEKGRDPAKIKDNVKKKLNGFLSPVKKEGTGWPFGRAVYPSEIHKIINEVEGVDYVSNLSLIDEKGQYHNDIVKISPVSLVYPGEHQLKMIEA